jgi:RIO kinase 1
MIHRLHAAGVRVPVPQAFVDGVLVMELITDADGNPAPRLADLVFDPDGARAMYERLLREVVRMLCAGVVHGDLSDFNVLVGADGPVIIDFPQSVDTAHNTNARRLLLRDVDNLHRFLSQFVPHARRLPYAEEMWDLFQQNAITPETRLTGRYRPSERRANTHAVLELIQDANYDERKRRESLGMRGGPPAGGAPPGAPPRRQEPARNGPSRQPPPRNGPPRGAPPPQQPQASRGPQPKPPGRRRDERRPEVIITHRRPMPR